MAERGTRGGDTASGEQLCLACGLCCRGIWFPHVKLKPNEVETARRAGFPVEDAGDEPMFHQPCVMHQGGKCSAYASWRPSACIEFRCQLLKSCVKGDVSLAEALGHVEAARGMAEELQTELGGVKGGLRGDQFVTYLRDETTADIGGRATPSPKTRLTAVALNLYYTRYFKAHAKPDIGT